MLLVTTALIGCAIRAESYSAFFHVDGNIMLAHCFGSDDNWLGEVVDDMKKGLFFDWANLPNPLAAVSVLKLFVTGSTDPTYLFGK